MRQNAPFVSWARNSFRKKSIKAFASAKAGGFPLLPQGNGFIPIPAIWVQGKEVLKEKQPLDLVKMEEIMNFLVEILSYLWK